MNKTAKVAILLPLLLLLLARGLKSIYQDHHFSIKCTDVIWDGYIYQISVRNTSHLNMTGEIKIQNRYSYSQSWMTPICAEDKPYKEWTCLLSSKKFSKHRFGEVRLLNNKDEELLKTEDNFYRYKENYECYKDHGFKMFNILSENINSLAFSYELYPYDIEHFVSKWNPLLVEHYPVHMPENVTYYWTDGIMRGSNHEIITNLKPCTQYKVCAKINFIAFIKLHFEENRCLLGSTYCPKSPQIIEIKQKDYTPVYGLGALCIIICASVVFFMKRKYSKPANRLHTGREQTPLTVAPPLPKRPKHLQTRSERILRVLYKTKKSKGGSYAIESVRVVDEPHLRLSLSNKDYALKHLYTSVGDVPTSVSTMSKEIQFAEKNDHTFTVLVTGEQNTDSNISGNLYDTETYPTSSLSDVCTSTSESSGDYNIY